MALVHEQGQLALRPSVASRAAPREQLAGQGDVTYSVVRPTAFFKSLSACAASSSAMRAANITVDVTCFNMVIGALARAGEREEAEATTDTDWRTATRYAELSAGG